MRRFRKTSFIQFTNWNDRRGDWYCMSMLIERYNRMGKHVIQGSIGWWLFE